MNGPIIKYINLGDDLKFLRHLSPPPLFSNHSAKTIARKDVSHFSSNPSSGFSLTGHVIATHTVPSRMDCTFECLANPDCLSFNYVDDWGHPLHVCELSDATLTSHPLALVKRPGYSYYEDNFVSLSRFGNLIKQFNLTGFY